MDNNINSITINSKSNGIILKMELDTLLNNNKITAWQSTSGWFYLTLYEVKGDSSKLIPKFIPKEIRKFQIIENKESLQIGIRINEPIENYDFIYNKEKKLIIANLHYSTEYFSMIDNLKQTNQSNLKVTSKNKSTNWLYKTGAFITLLGLVDSKEPFNNNTSKIGIGILITSFLIDTLIQNYFNI
tara:strand:+ start:1573 stop:2130 length:558 start_codon:yes stop_codon:yes gene_type:complete